MLAFLNHEQLWLSAKLDWPAGNAPKAFAILTHCFTCSKDYKLLTWLSQALTAQGLAVLRFDFTGLGKSEGQFSQTNFSTMVADVISASVYLSESYQAPQLLIGHSLGGTVLLQAAAHIPSAVAVVTINSPASPAHIIHHFQDQLPLLQQQGQATITLAGRPFLIRQQLIADLYKIDLKPAIHQLKKALLIFHAPEDTVVPVYHAQQLFQQAQYPKSFIALDGADHLLSNPQDAYFTGQLAAQWSQRYWQA